MLSLVNPEQELQGLEFASHLVARDLHIPLLDDSDDY